MAKSEKKVSITLTQEKVTKNTIRFEEKLESELDVPVLGNIYIPKATLKSIGYAEGATITVELSC